jgi:hypothetical protein
LTLVLFRVVLLAAAAPLILLALAVRQTIVAYDAFHARSARV